MIMIPTKDIIEDLYNRINEDGFQGSLKSDPRLSIGHSSTNMGLFIEWGKGKINEIVITDFYDFEEEVLISVLAHEMCHQWCYDNGYSEIHGKHWKAKAKEVGERLGVEIERTIDLKNSKVNPIYKLKYDIKEMKDMVNKVLEELRKENFPKENYWFYVGKETNDFKLKATEEREDGFIGYFIEDDKKLGKIINLVLTYKKLKKSC